MTPLNTSYLKRNLKNTFNVRITSPKQLNILTFIKFITYAIKYLYRVHIFGGPENLLNW